MQHHDQHPGDATAGIVASHENSGHDRHEGHSVAMFRDKFWLSLALTIPTVLLSPEVAGDPSSSASRDSESGVKPRSAARRAP